MPLGQRKPIDTSGWCRQHRPWKRRHFSGFGAPEHKGAMPYRTFTIEEVADYLHLSRDDVGNLVKNHDIPFEKHGNRIVFRRADLDLWASQRILGLEGKRLAEYHQRTTRQTRDLLSRAALVPEMMDQDFIAEALPSKTKASVLRAMASLARATGRVTDERALLDELQAREELCSTGMPGGLALLHQRHPDPYLIELPFIALGRTVQQIPFGAPDGQGTQLFFLLGCPDDRLHLHTLARICLMVQKTALLDELRSAANAAEMYSAMVTAEKQVLEATICSDD